MYTMVHYYIIMKLLLLHVMYCLLINVATGEVCMYEFIETFRSGYIEV
jgi:hypothetical protein